MEYLLNPLLLLEKTLQHLPLQRLNEGTLLELIIHLIGMVDILLISFVRVCALYVSFTILILVYVLCIKSFRT